MLGQANHVGILVIGFGKGMTGPFNSAPTITAFHPRVSLARMNVAR
jgi:hypothetical protein